ncbi:MAG: mannose-1-phosphate guanylyltransferase/mannose-6-phosphate isomerase [Nitrosomonadales bacterium]|nr:mannose-1-phosphate guanylyltransferase/mannose-6-phosphate isomerase [Nitrosomonadales bacterium]
MIYPVILSGGSGTRLWPLSRKSLPKQFLSLVSEKTLFQETLQRLRGVPDIASPVVVCNTEHRFLAAEQLRAIDINPLSLILEPISRNTAPAVAAAALAAQERDADAILLILPADHLIQDVLAFHRSIQSALKLANEGKLVTFGCKPTKPSTGFGYIEQGDAIEGMDGAFDVARFVEKPKLETAESFLASGKFFWNSGMFMFKASAYLEELQKYQLSMYEASLQAWQKGRHGDEFSRLDKEAFELCPDDSIDYAVMEQTKIAAMVTVNIGWGDIGSWDALAEVVPADAQGNVVRGDVYAPETKRSYIRAESRLVAAIGLDDMVIVETPDAVLVAHKDFSQNVKNAVEYLKRAERTEHLVHSRNYRPWGYYESVDVGERYQVKRIVVKPRAKLSLQSHEHRAEHWIVVNGSAIVTVDKMRRLVESNESVYIPVGATHRLENVGETPLCLIEVQTGSYLGEDDIIRYEDIYQRV